MWLPKANGAKKETGSGSVAVAIDKDKGSQHALKWTIDNLASRGHWPNHFSYSCPLQIPFFFRS
ncbi:unnamed protein product [Arabidopsis halleri]